MDQRLSSGPRASRCSIPPPPPSNTHTQTPPHPHTETHTHTDTQTHTHTDTHTHTHTSQRCWATALAQPESLHGIQIPLPLVLRIEGGPKRGEQSFPLEAEEVFKGSGWQITSVLSARSWGQRFSKECASLCLGDLQTLVGCGAHPWEGPFLPGSREDPWCRKLHPLPCILPWSWTVFLKTHARIPGSADFRTEIGPAASPLSISAVGSTAFVQALTISVLAGPLTTLLASTLAPAHLLSMLSIQPSS